MRYSSFLKEQRLFLPATFALVALLLTTCSAAGPERKEGEQAERSVMPSQAFMDHWYKGTGEVNTYALVQARYGEKRSGHAVLIFVTEDQLVKGQVKYDGIGDAARQSVLKLNRIERFATGIYDYSMMTSVFSPVDQSGTTKITCTVQDWCGQAFMQWNRRADGYHLEVRSYFQQEGDASIVVVSDRMEDGLWNQIRIAPQGLPQGEVSIVPSSTYLRLMHRDARPYRAMAELEARSDTSYYRLGYPELQRTLEIRFGTAFPYEIYGWTESRPDGFGPDRTRLLTEASRITQVVAPYWELNGTMDDPERARIGLPGMGLH